jgi:hypothetical protein
MRGIAVLLRITLLRLAGFAYAARVASADGQIPEEGQ